MHADNEAESLPVELAAEVFRMLADPTRVRLLWAMLEQELSVNELAVLVGKPSPSRSQHLAKLRTARLLRGSEVSSMTLSGSSQLRVMEPVGASLAG